MSSDEDRGSMSQAPSRKLRRSARGGTGQRRRFPRFLAVPITLLLWSLLLIWAIQRGNELGMI